MEKETQGKKSDKNRLYWLILVFAIVTLGAIVANNYIDFTKTISWTSSDQPIKFVRKSPTSGPTASPISSEEVADWKTYTNTKYGYSIKYPSDWYVYGADGSRSNVETNATANFAKEGATDRSFYVNVASRNDYAIHFGPDTDEIDQIIKQALSTFQFTK